MLRIKKFMELISNVSMVTLSIGILMFAGCKAANSDGDGSVPVNKAAGVSHSEDIDDDPDQLRCTVTITKATEESDITHYVLYWGSDATTKLAGKEAIATIAKTDADVTTDIAENTEIHTNGATHFLVFTKNDDGEMQTGVNTIITDTEP